MLSAAFRESLIAGLDGLLTAKQSKNIGEFLSVFVNTLELCDTFGKTVSNRFIAY